MVNSLPSAENFLSKLMYYPCSTSTFLAHVALN
jgi:hypothetical protein